MRHDRPCYDLLAVKGAISRGEHATSGRVSRTLRNHGYFSPDEVVTGVFEAMQDSHFHKCDELEKIPGTYADIYKDVPWDGNEWYVKFFQREDGKTVIEVWSLKGTGWN